MKYPCDKSLPVTLLWPREIIWANRNEAYLLWGWLRQVRLTLYGSYIVVGWQKTEWIMNWTGGACAGYYLSILPGGLAKPRETVIKIADVLFWDWSQPLPEYESMMLLLGHPVQMSCSTCKILVRKHQRRTLFLRFKHRYKDDDNNMRVGWIQLAQNRIHW
jgi:hypothetical protein